jgi:hypothetical protein
MTFNDGKRPGSPASHTGREEPCPVSLPPDSSPPHLLARGGELGGQRQASRGGSCLHGQREKPREASEVSPPRRPPCTRNRSGQGTEEAVFLLHGSWGPWLSRA